MKLCGKFEIKAKNAIQCSSKDFFSECLSEWFFFYVALMKIDPRKIVLRGFKHRHWDYYTAYEQVLKAHTHSQNVWETMKKEEEEEKKTRMFVCFFVDLNLHT